MTSLPIDFVDDNRNHQPSQPRAGTERVEWHLAQTRRLASCQRQSVFLHADLYQKAGRWRVGEKVKYTTSTLLVAYYLRAYLTVSYGNVPLCCYMQSIFFQDQTFPLLISHGLDHHCLRI